jgi:hypothetical protein
MSFNNGKTRNDILDAALGFFQGIAPWQSAPSRKFKTWDDVPHAARPAMFLVKTGEERTHNDFEGLPPSITMDVTMFIYTWAPQSVAVPDTQLQDILDSVDKALAPSPLMGSKQTLGGLVSHCWIEGRTLTIPGDLDGDGIAVIPLKILIPS